jgi:hypothetical protein
LILSFDVSSAYLAWLAAMLSTLSFSSPSWDTTVSKASFLALSATYWFLSAGFNTGLAA